MSNQIKKILVEIALVGISVKCYKEIDDIIKVLDDDFKFNEIILTLKALSLYHQERFDEVVILINPYLDKFPDLIFICILASEKLNNNSDIERFIKLAISSDSDNARQFANEFQDKI